MDYAGLIASYGYAAVFLGTLIEGETVLALAGFAAHRGYLALPAVIAVALAGSLLGDQLAFAAGRRWGAGLLARFPSLAAPAAQVARRLERHATWFILANRFMYGLRLAGPVAIGMSAVSWPRFAALNAIGATIWAIAIALVGYVFGEILGRVLDDLRAAEVWVFGAGLVVLLAVAIRRLLSRRRAAPPAGASGGS
jgi:membrane protein DedA with SNARE-associated domain